MGENGSKRVTFWKIIKKNQIEIPVIQRDYAQGRTNKRVTQIREGFVKALISSINNTDSESKPLHLDFVFGRIKGKDKEKIIVNNKKAIENVVFAVQGYAKNLNMNIEYKIVQKREEEELTSRKLIPLDGQQRLTTLFLLHWYILKRITTEDKEYYLKTLHGFKYRTRKSTTDFCDYLTKQKNEVTFIPEKNITISEQIEKSSRFYSIWNNDPSVKGMLVMLDEIHSKLKSKNENELYSMWLNLIQNRRITFDFLDLDTLKQTDDLYVKMNARGKYLSDFEHFKAWLQDYLNKDNKVNISYQDWEHKMDTDWLDLLWFNNKDGNYNIDSVYYNFIKNITLFTYINQKDKESIVFDLIDVIRESNTDKNFIPLSDYKKYNFFTTETLAFLFTTLESLSNKVQEIKNRFNKGDNIIKVFSSAFSNDRVLSLFINNKTSFPNLWDTVYYYAFILFINDVEEINDDNIDKFEKWMRISRNLIYNTYIQKNDDFINAIKSINKIAKYKFTIEEKIYNGLNIPFFATQAKEEKRKLEYFKLGNNWKNKIIEYENHNYFYGQINFMFELIRDDKNNFEQFVRYGDRLYSLFSDDIEEKNHLLQRALLSHEENYTIHLSGKKHSFCKSDHGGLRARNDNWRKVYNNEDRLKILKSILDDSRDLEKISRNSFKLSWRKFVIDFPEVISYCTNRYFDFHDDLDIRLLKKNDYRGKHTDIYLYIIFIKLKKIEIELESINFTHVSVNSYRSVNNYPTIEITNLDRDLVANLYYRYDIHSFNRGFEIVFYIDNYQDLFKEFTSINNRKYIIIEDINKVESVLKYIVNEIGKISNL